MKYRTHNRRKRLMRTLQPAIKDLEIGLTDEEVLADLGFAYTRIPTERKGGV
jgi:hypothetical protein